jgi:GNAT superfamily N-acetyltransferase
MPRLLTEADVPAALELSTAAGWNQTAEDWRRIITLEPEACFGIDCDDKLVATATLICYGTDLAWIGMVLTHRDYQRRGYARELMQTTLDLADFRRVRSVKLDATDQGRPLYASMGFEDEQPIERWQRAAGEPVGASLDRIAFGADRSRLLDALGSALHRPGTRARYLGPIVAANPATARTLIEYAIACAPADPWFWDLLPANAAAVALAGEFGFAPVRRLVRMVRGERLGGDDTMVYATAGFEFG